MNTGWYLLALSLLPLGAVWALPVISDLLSFVWIRLLSHSTPAVRSVEVPFFLFVVPAHNEIGMVGECIRSLTGMETQSSRFNISVVADNCTDETARAAREAGAAVYEREDATRKGKPAAVQWLLDQIDLSAYTSIVIIDADSVVVPGFADALAEIAALREKVVQGYYGLENEDETWLSRLAGLLVRVRYEGQYVLKEKAGLNCPLTGNGMCIGTSVLRRNGWSDDSLTENWDMYARFTAMGEEIRFAPRAHLYAHESSTLSESATRRRRWQAGRWAVLRDHAASLIKSRRVGARQKIDALAEISGLGPVVQASIAVIATIFLSLQPVPTLRWIAVPFGLSLLHLSLWTALVLATRPNRKRLLLDMLRLPFYAFWRMLIVGLSVATGRKGAWNRSPRKTPS